MNDSMDDICVTPQVLDEEQKQLCRRLDSLHRVNRLSTKPSKMLAGALWVSDHRHRKLNKDWESQAACSLREIIYPFWSPRRKDAPDKGDAFRFFAGHADVEKLDRIYVALNGKVHHNARPDIEDEQEYRDFDQVKDEFMTVMRHALETQFDRNREIREIVSDGPERTVEQDELD